MNQPAVGITEDQKKLLQIEELMMYRKRVFAVDFDTSSNWSLAAVAAANLMPVHVATPVVRRKKKTITPATAAATPAKKEHASATPVASPAAASTPAAPVKVETKAELPVAAPAQLDVPAPMEMDA
jgi:hypothetical protein